MDCGADPNKADKSGLTPLNMAVQYGHQGVVKALLEKGADIETETDLGITTLHNAVRNYNSPLDWSKS